MNEEMKILIAGEEILCGKDIAIKEDILSPSSTILKNCYPKSWEEDKDYTSRFFVPIDYSKCLIYKGANLIFAGVAKNTGNILLKPTDPKYLDLQILDFKTLLSESTTLDFVITNKTVKGAIEQVIEAISSYGFILGEININAADDIIGAYSTANQTAYDVFQYITEITQSKWFARLVDENTVAIDFIDTDKLPIKENIEYTTEYFENNNIVDMTWSYSTRDYRNRQTINSEKVYGSIDNIERPFVNGYSTQYNLEQSVGELKKITVNGVEKTTALETYKQLGVTADFYYNIDSNLILTDTTYPQGTVIEVTYIPIIQGREVAQNSAEIDRITNEIGRNGIIARYETRNDILNNAELAQVANTYIKYKGNAEINLKIKTYQKDIFEIGNQTYFNMTQISYLAKQYMVKTKTINKTVINDEEIIFYEYDLSSNFESEKAINYFDNQRRKANGNITAGQFITRNVDASVNLNIVYEDFEIIQETPITEDNIIEATLDCAFID